MNNIKENLIEGKWVIELLVPFVKKEIVKRLALEDESLENYSLTYLAHKYYQPNSNLILKTYKPSKITFLNQTVDDCYVNHLLQNLLKNNSLSISPKVSNTIHQWTENFYNSNNKDLGKFLEYIVLIENASFNGASHPHFLGSIFMSVSDNTTIQDFHLSLVHECAHQELFLLNYIDRLINKTHENHLLYAPFQNKLRPPIGRLHSLHALYRMIQVEAKEELLTKFKQNIEAVQLDELTEFGKFLLNSVYTSYEKNT
ncbi:MAG: HEXXH motif-containing putative peptide modification protein [Bacteriovoracaceae bacterium]